MKKIVFFSNNQNKIDEVLRLFSNSSIKILSLKNFPKLNEPEEDGNSFEKNAEIKSQYGFKHLQVPCFADDSGICISALNDLPGVNSKRFLEENGGAEKTLKMIIDQTNKLINKQAYFKTSVCLTINEKKMFFFNGVIQGEISTTPKGQHGFHYDPIFIPNGYKKTFAEMTINEKNRISHRAIAIKKLIEYLS